MAFLESRMSVHIERDAKVIRANRGREKSYSKSGRLYQNFTWPWSLNEFDISHGILLPNGWAEIDAMWEVVNFTPYSGLRFRNWSDYQGVKGNTSLLNTSSNFYQLRRARTFAAVTRHKPVYKPNSDVVIYDAADAACTFTLDTTTGIATVTAGTPSYWVGTFDYPVTFKDNEMMARLNGTTSNLIMIAEPIILEELML